MGVRGLGQRRWLSSTHQPFLLRQPLPRRPARAVARPTPINQQRKRYVSTEIKEVLKYQVKLGLYWTAVGWVVLGGLAIGGFVLRQDWLDKQHPAPSEWHWYIKCLWRDASHRIERNGRESTDIKWGDVGPLFRAVVASLEDFHFIFDYPSGLQQQVTVDDSIPGVNAEEMKNSPSTNPLERTWASPIGYDITIKSTEWRQGYYTAMMNAAKAAEMRVGYLKHKKTRKVFPPQFVRSESNPYPRPIQSPETIENPDEADCEPILESADFLYRRVLTTKGFSRRQRMDAGLAYAAWLEFQGNMDLARQMYDWSFRLALEGVPDPTRILDTKTGVIKASAPFVTPNILTTVTALAGFEARCGDTASALSMFTSLLRARQAAPQASPSEQYPVKPSDYSLSSVASLLNYIRSLPFRPEMPPPQPNGDAPYERSKKEECEEGALMAYVGEIVFARGGRRPEGLEWTKRAHEVAQARVDDPRQNADGQTTCKQCLHTSLENWHRMVQILAKERREMPAASSWSWLAWSDPDRDLIRSKDWDKEEERVGTMLGEYERREFNRRLEGLINANSKMFVL